MKNKKRIVVKVGTSSLTGRSEPGAKAGSGLEPLVREICRLRDAGHEVILVTSGAIGAGIRELGWAKRPDNLHKKQAAAAVGQVTLMRTYQDLFRAQGRTVAQVLLTRDDFEDRKRYLNARHTLLALLELGAVPVINENDTVAVEEIQFGDNDRLSALVAVKIDADLLIILSNVDGLLRGEGAAKELVQVVPKITPEVERLAWKGVKSELGTGGMSSKIEAAKITTAGGITTYIANANAPNVLTDILDGKGVGTKFVSLKSVSAKEKWILFGALPKGTIVVDEGAARAIRESQKSLLAAGVREVSGSFRRGDVVSIRGSDGAEFARGVSSFSADQVQKIQGQKSQDVRKILGPGSASEVVHRDSLAVFP